MATAADRTKGEWEARPPAGADKDCDPRFTICVKGEELNVICITAQGNDEANGKYIALAPEMEQVLVDMVRQHCYEHEDGTIDSGGLSTDAEAIELLADLGRLEIISGKNRMLTAKWVE
jgi:hypothetical protein